MRTRSIIRDTRGAAYTEAIIVLPVFIFLWAGVVYVGQAFQAKSVATQTARRCAWAYANGGCDAVPEGCEGFVGNDTRGNDDALSGSDSSQIKSDLADIERESGGRNVEALDGILDSIAGKDTRAVGGVTVERPRVLGGGRQRAVSGYRVMCNEKERTLAGVAKDAFCNLTSLCGGGS